MKNFKEGDKVKLISGSPIMVISKVIKDELVQKSIMVMWYDVTRGDVVEKIIEGREARAVLEIVEDDQVELLSPKAPVFPRHTEPSDLGPGFYEEGIGFPLNDPRPDDCLHSSCPACRGLGVKPDGGICIHNISCPCSRCSPRC